MSITALPPSQAGIHLLPEETLLQVLQYLSPKDKKIAAAACRLWQRLAEDPRSLLADYTAGKNLSTRQLSQIFAAACEGSELQYKIAIQAFEKPKFKHIPFISEKTVACILNLFTTHGLPKGLIGISRGTVNNRQCYAHLARLELLEYGLHSSQAFSMEKIISIFHAHIESMKSQGFKVNVGFQDKNFIPNLYTPLASAVHRKCPALIRALCQAGAQVDRPSLNLERCMPIHYLTMDPALNLPVPQRRIELCLKALLDHGADINAATEIHNFTPLWYAANYRKDDAVETLIKNGADIDFETQSTYGDLTALQAAARRGHESTVRTLIKLGADPSIKNQEAKTAAELARNKHYHNIAEFLDSHQIPPWRKKLKQIFEYVNFLPAKLKTTN